MNEATCKMRDKPRVLPINPSDLVVDSLQQAKTVFSRYFTLAVELAEASVQTIKFGPFKIIHLHRLPIPTSVRAQDGQAGCSRVVSNPIG